MQFQAFDLGCEQTEDLQTIINKISEQNKLQLQDVLAEKTQIQSTSILTLYNIVVDQWQAKRKIIDNLCQFSNSILGTFDFFREQASIKDHKINHADNVINNLQNQIYQLHDVNELYKQKLNQAELKLESLQQEKEESRNQLQQSLTNEAHYHKQLHLQQHQIAIQSTNAQLIRQSSLLIIQKEQDIQVLHKQKQQLLSKLEEMSQESKLYKMQLQLAQIAIDQVISSRRQLEYMLKSNVESQSCNKQQERNFIEDIQLSCNSLVDRSQLQKKLLSNQFQSQQDLLQFASTPCLFFTQKQPFQENTSILSLNQSLIPPSSPPSIIKLQNHNTNTTSQQPALHKKQKSNHQQNNKENDEQNSSFSEDENAKEIIGKLYLYDSVIDLQKQSMIRLTDESQLESIISRLNIQQSKISEFQATQTSFFHRGAASQHEVSSSVNLFSSLLPQSSRLKKTSSFNKNQSFFSYFAKKVVKNRIRSK